MKLRKLGRTGISVSVIGFGGIPIGSLNFLEAEKSIKHAIDVGITFFDTAPNYGASERNIGRVLEERRDKYIIATKTDEKTSADVVSLGIEKSLNKLRTSYIDLIQLHGIDSKWTLKKVMSTRGVLEALKKAREQSKVKFIGITGHKPAILIEAIKTEEFDTVMVPLNIYNQEATKELIPLANEMDVGIIIMKPFGGKGSKWSPRKIILQPISVDLHKSARLHLEYILTQKISTTIPGFRSAEEINAAVKLVD